MSDDLDRSRTRGANTTDGSVGQYDHAISLVDTTLPQSESAPASRGTSPEPSWRKLARKATKTSVREQLARRKYAKWQGERVSYTGADTAALSQESSRRPEAPVETPSPSVEEEAEEPAQTEPVTTDLGPQIKRGVGKPLSKPYLNGQTKEKHSYQVDILYENQRGLFFFGMPLYSHSSLLNFDPAPWVTKDLKDSAVNITNAQVPDPSWEWQWKSWYVDMSYDVDEEGWQYSFSFGKRWAWHGTHPWFHSYVRRRRWLRKRVKRHYAAPKGGDGSLNTAHLLTGDYFTIHSKRDRSPASTVDGTARFSYVSRRTMADEDDPPEDIRDIPSLLKALRLATIDREKIVVVQKFVEQGGEELAYLEHRIPEIMSFLVFQTSKKHLLQHLRQAAVDARAHRDEHTAENEPENEAETRRIDNISQAVKAANAQITDLEYWSDRKSMLKSDDEPSGKVEAGRRPVQPGGVRDLPTEDNPVVDIKGILDQASLDVDPTLKVFSNSSHAPIDEKGKGKAPTSAAAMDDTDSAHVSFNGPPSRLPVDSTFTSDDPEER